MLLGAKPEVNNTCKTILANQGVNIVCAQDGYYENESIVFDLIKEHCPDIVIVALGSPKQEKLIAKLRELHDQAFYMGVGGSFDVLSGNVKRAPKLWRKLNLEWLYRLLCEPTRIKRQIKLLAFLRQLLTNKL